MTPDQIPPNLKAMLDAAAGRKHSASGPVMTALAEILAEWDRSRGTCEECKKSKVVDNHSV